MLTIDKKNLEIFAGNGITIDVSLPKYKNILDNSNNNFFSFVDNPNRNIHLNNANEKKTLFGKVKSYIKKLIHDYKEDKNKTLDVIDFFSNVKAVSDLNKDKYIQRLKDYLKAISNAEKSGQYALKEKLIEEMIINKYESVLYANSLYKCITEKQMVEFAKKSKRNVELTYIKNYVRLIPGDIIALKNDIDRMEIFDNYVILHYDPNHENVKMTKKDKEEEERRMKDPILFGVINGSRKLYFIADWIDEGVDDDLKFKDIIDTLGESNVEGSYLKEKIKFV